MIKREQKSLINLFQKRNTSGLKTPDLTSKRKNKSNFIVECYKTPEIKLIEEVSWKAE